MRGFVVAVAVLVALVLVVPADGSWQVGILLVIGALIVASVVREQARRRR